MTGQPSRAALLILDAINPFDFDGARDIAPAAMEASRVIARLRKAADAARAPVIYVNDNYGHWGSEKDEIVSRAGRASAAAKTIVGRLTPRKSDYFVIKPQFSGFYATNLTALLDTLAVRRLALAGFAADICVLFTAADAHMRGYRLWIPGDAVAAEGDERRRWALGIMAQSMGARTEPTTALSLEDWAKDACTAP